MAPGVFQNPSNCSEGQPSSRSASCFAESPHSPTRAREDSAMVVSRPQNRLLEGKRGARAHASSARALSA